MMCWEGHFFAALTYRFERRDYKAVQYDVATFGDRLMDEKYAESQAGRLELEQQ
jgi:hypothetical protein